MSEGETTFLAVIEGRQQPDPALVKAGWDAHEAGREFHEGPRPFATVEALCWRIGWNDRARWRRTFSPPLTPTP